MHLTAFLLGAATIGVSAIMKKTPVEWTNWFPRLNEDESETKLPAQYQAAFDQSKTALLMEDD
jgi:hypothetical protein